MFKCLISHLLLLLELKNILPGYSKTCAASLKHWSDLTSDPFFKVKLGSLIFKCFTFQILLILQLKRLLPGYRKPCAETLMQ